MDEGVGPGLWTPSAGGLPRPVGVGMWVDVPVPRYAGFWRRFVASLVDGVILWVLGQAVAIGLGDILPIGAEEDALLEAPWRALGASFLALIAIGFLAGWVYCAGFESSPWRATPGKRLLGVAVTDLVGNRLSVARASGRYLAESFTSALFLIGYLVQPFTERRQALHDILAETLVVRR